MELIIIGHGCESLRKESLSAKTESDEFCCLNSVLNQFGNKQKGKRYKMENVFL